MAQAQVLERPSTVSLGPVAVAGDVSIVFGPRDTTAFFNYTDYEQNALRAARIRLAADWRIGRGLSLVGDVRSENADEVDVAALFLRWRPWSSRGLTIQAGRVPPVVGAFPRRAYGRDNIVAGTPLAYQYLTSLRSDALPLTTQELLRMRARGWRPSYSVGSQSVATGVPMVNAARWDTGVEAQWRTPWLDLAGAVTRGAPAVPVVRDDTEGWQWSARGALQTPVGLIVGVSAARGSWIADDALSLVPAALRERSAQTLWGVDAEYGAGRWLTRAEYLRTTFQLPVAGAARTFDLPAASGFLELRYRAHARWQIAGRAERLYFDRVLPTAEGAATWDLPVTRLETALGFRAARQIELRAGVQRNWRAGARTASRTFPFGQLLYWF